MEFIKEESEDIKTAFIKEESEDVKIEETFRVKQEETEEQKGWFHSQRYLLKCTMVNKITGG